ncbi:MAG: Na+/H+ antiporter subunit E [Rhodobacteraceae bacterium]|nr:Na+/H+ antiporter subunit E [Paracoccaceae bacterium]
MSKRQIKAVLHRTALCALVWLALTRADPGAFAPGVAVVAAAVWLSLRLLPARHPLALWRLALHLPRFLAGSVTGGLDVARRALSRDMGLRPGWISLRADLPPGGRVALGCEVSLMPGTLAAGSRADGRLLVHVLDTEAGFERMLGREAQALARIAELEHSASSPGGGDQA